MLSFDNKKKLAVAISVYCALVISVIVIGQFDKLSGVISAFLSAFSPIFIGFAIAYLLNPILKFYENKVFKRIKNKRALRIVGIFFTYLSLCLFLCAIGMLVIPQVTASINDLSSKFDTYKASTLAMIDSFLDTLKESGIISAGINSDTLIKFISDNFSFDANVGKTILTFLATNLQSFLIIPKNILIGIFISLYALYSKDHLSAQFKKALKAIFSEKTYTAITHRIDSTHSTFGGYFTGVVIDAVFVGVVSFVAMLIFKVPYASLVAVLVAVTNVIPVFGPFIGAIPSALIIFISEPEKVIIFIILILVIQQIDGNIIAPRILGNSTGMSSLAVIIAITVMGSAFGFMGMFIGVPVFAVIIALIKEITEERLAQKGLSKETASYYPKNSMAEPPAAHTSVTNKLFDAIAKLLKKIFKKKNKQKKQ